jgi:hypothetical protein
VYQGDKKIVTILLYAPMQYRKDVGFTPNTPTMWYYRWQRKLWDYFSARKGMRFIWKVYPNNYLDDPIRHLRASNIRYSTRSLGRELRRADLVFVDYPSTPMWNAMERKIPVLCVTFWELRKLKKYSVDGCNIFKRLPYDHSFDDAFRFIDLFIDCHNKGMSLFEKRFHPNKGDWLGRLKDDSNN